MLEDDLKRHGIKDEKVFQAMRKVERHLFVEPNLEPFAYEDAPLPIGYEQTISQPYIVAFMTQAAEIKEWERVLEIGTGSGYQAAILAELAKEVYTVEIIRELAESAKQRLKSLGYANVHVKCGDGHEGWPEHAPYDAIIVTAAPEKTPRELLHQLAMGGRMVVPVGADSQDLYLYTKDARGIHEKKSIPVKFVPMVGGGG